jgi:hypothetical protein
MKSTTRWHVATWPPLAWVETIIKGIGQIIGIWALVSSFSTGDFATPQGIRLVQTILMTVLAWGLSVGILDRIRYREIISMVFILTNNLAHWGIVLSFLFGQNQFLIPFTLFFLIGDLVKIIFIRVNRFTVGNFSQTILYGLTSFYVLGYLVIFFLELIK